MLQIHHFWFLRLVENKQKENIKLARPNIKLLKLDAIVPNTVKWCCFTLCCKTQRHQRLQAKTDDGSRCRRERAPTQLGYRGETRGRSDPRSR